MNQEWIDNTINTQSKLCVHSYSMAVLLTQHTVRQSMYHSIESNKTISIVSLDEQKSEWDLERVLQANKREINVFNSIIICFSDNGFPDVITMHIMTFYPSIWVAWLCRHSIRDDRFSAHLDWKNYTAFVKNVIYVAYKLHKLQTFKNSKLNIIMLNFAIECSLHCYNEANNI